MTKEVAKFVKALKKDGTVPGDKCYEESVFLGAAAFAGTNADAISRASDLPRALCRKLAQKARAAGLFKRGKILCEWADKKSGAVAFYCDVAVLCGWLERK